MSGSPVSARSVVGDRRERQQLHVVDLDRHRAAPVDAPHLDLRSGPQAVGDGDGPVRHPVSELRAELHAPIVRPTGAGCRPVGQVLRSADLERQITAGPNGS